MENQTEFQKLTILTLRNLWDTLESDHQNGAAMAEEIRFARQALQAWEEDGLQEAARWVASGLAVKRALDAC